MSNDPLEYQKVLESAFRRMTHQETWQETLEEIVIFQEELENWKTSIKSLIQECTDADK